jgi:uncharacterized repeat protein (TIGR01451 family)
MNRTHLAWLLGSALAVGLVAVVATISPVRIQISIDSQAVQANAAEQSRRNLPTTTPEPPTAIPPTAPPPTATPVPPMATVVVPTATAAPPAERRSRATPTATVEPTIALPIVQPPQVSILKQVSPAEAQPGQLVTYTLTLQNQGSGPAHDVVVTDELPSALEIIDLHSSKGDIAVDGQRVNAYPRSLTAGETQVYTIVTRVRPATPAGPLGNTAVVTLSDPGDTPGDNLSTATLQIRAPIAAQRLPKTADPSLNDTLLTRYWPLLVLACGVLLLGVAIRQGAFRQQFLRVQIASAAGQGAAPQISQTAEVQLNRADLWARWQAGASTQALVELVARQNPSVDLITISLAVQEVLSARAQTQPTERMR